MKSKKDHHRLYSHDRVLPLGVAVISGTPRAAGVVDLSDKDRPEAWRVRPLLIHWFISTRVIQLLAAVDEICLSRRARYEFKLYTLNRFAELVPQTEKWIRNKILLFRELNLYTVEL